MPLETKDTMESAGLSREYLESLYDSQMSGAERIKTAVIDLVVMAANNNPKVYPSDKLGLFFLIVEIADSLDSMKVSFNELYDTYCEIKPE